MSRNLRLLKISLLSLAISALLAAGLSIVYADNDYQSNPAPDTPLAPITVTWESGPKTSTDTLTIQSINPGPGPALILQSISMSQNPSGVFSLRIVDPNTQQVIQPASFPLDLSALAGRTVNVQVSCEFNDPVNTPNTFNGVITVNHNSPVAGTLSNYPITCNAISPNYTSNPAVGSTVTIDTNVDTPKNQVVVTVQEGTNPPMANIADLKFTPSLVGQNNQNVPPEITLVSPTNETTLAGGLNGTQDITARCDPTVNGTIQNPQPGTKVAVLQIQHNDVDSPPPDTTVTYQIECVVIGLPKYGSTPPNQPAPNFSTINLGNVQVGQQRTVADALVVNNTTGTAPLRILSMSITGTNSNNFKFADPNQATNGFTVAIGGNTSVGLVCEPTDANPNNRTAELRVTYETNNPTQPQTTAFATYNLACNAQPALAVYNASSPYKLDANGTTTSPGTLSPTTNGDRIRLPNVVVGNTQTFQDAIRIENTGSSTLIVTSATFIDGSGSADVTGADAELRVTAPSFSQQVSSGNAFNIAIQCTPVNDSARTSDLSIEYSDTVNTTTVVYGVICQGVTTAPNIALTPNPLAINGTVLQPGNATATITNSGTGDLNVTSSAIVNPNVQGVFTITSGGGAQTVGPNGGTGNVAVRCTSNTAGTYTATLQVNSSNSPAVTVPITCTIGTTVLGPQYTSSPDVGGTVNISTTTGVTGTGTLTITNAGGSQLIIRNVGFSTSASQISESTSNSADPFTVAAGSSNTLTFNCSSTTTGTFTRQLSVTHSASNVGSPVSYTVSCTVSNPAATATTTTSSAVVTSTPVSSVTGTSITPCDSSQVLSTPFPQNASGEFLAVNCYIISTAGTVTVSLSQVLTDPYVDVNADRANVIRSNPGLMSVWRQGSWFLVPSTYNPATQTYSFDSQGGTNVYVFFYGGITLPEGAQGTTFAGTTTGNVTDILLSEEHNIPYALIVSSLIAGIVALVVVSRRLNTSAAVAED